MKINPSSKQFNAAVWPAGEENEKWFVKKPTSKLYCLPFDFFVRMEKWESEKMKSVPERRHRWHPFARRSDRPDGASRQSGDRLRTRKGCSGNPSPLCPVPQRKFLQNLPLKLLSFVFWFNSNKTQKPPHTIRNFKANFSCFSSVSKHD